MNFALNKIDDPVRLDVQITRIRNSGVDLGG